ncbi:hypothetical protein RvY_06138 [Ramazzottius varieornatus]|uniref:Uncharacterized protein n=1 Tax=Ramazzottius varieornatus TaxID=947166 RepID=A0A1D1V766_RAMVA|nr:hypothetical protein RvY_06138 [Ramazzottius varieornatus]
MPAYRMNGLQELPRRVGGDGFPVYRTAGAKAYQPKYVQFNEPKTCAGIKASPSPILQPVNSRQYVSEGTLAPAYFPPTALPVDVSSYHPPVQPYKAPSPQMSRSNLPTKPVEPPYNRIYGVPPPPPQVYQRPIVDHGNKPWSVHPPDPSLMRERLQRYRHDHKISGYGGFFPGTHEMLGGSVYRLVTDWEEKEHKGFYRDNRFTK